MLGANIFGTADATAGPAMASADAGAMAAFGPPTSAAARSGGHFHPGTGFGLAFWLGVGGVVALVVIRRSLPG